MEKKEARKMSVNYWCEGSCTYKRSSLPERQVWIMQSHGFQRIALKCLTMFLLMSVDILFRD